MAKCFTRQPFRRIHHSFCRIIFLLRAEIITFVFNASTQMHFCLFQRWLNEMGVCVLPPVLWTLYSGWHGLGAHLARPEKMVMHPEKKKKKSSRCLASRPSLQPSPSVSQKALQQPTEQARRWEGDDHGVCDICKKRW